MPNESPVVREIVPLKANAFAMLRGANTQLLPIFPYEHPGAIIPCCAAFESDGSGFRIGYFLHKNTVDEIVWTLGSNGTVRSGDFFAGAREHGVGGETSDAFFSAMIITQRQVEEGGQDESIAFPCEACSAELFRYEFDLSIVGQGKFGGLSTIVGSDAAAVAFNSDPSLRICQACGHESQHFPDYVWGWANYVRNTRVVENSWKAMQEASQ